MKTFTIDEAWSLAMKPGNSHSVIDIEGGGYAVPVHKSAWPPRPPTKRTRILVYTPDGEALAAITGLFGTWRIVHRFTRRAARARKG